MTNSNPFDQTGAERDRDAEGPPIAPDRRRFLAWLTAGLGGLGGLLVGVPVIGFIFSPLLRREDEMWRPVGDVDAFEVGLTYKVNVLDPAPLPWAGFSAQSAAWLRREAASDFVAFSIHCTHTGCPVRWDEGSSLFLCPCHGGVFYRDGSVAAGPPPAPLERQPVRVRNGRVEVRTIGLPIPGE